MDVEVVERPERFRSLEPDWNRLLIASDHDSPFMSWDWMDSWWRHIGSGRLKIVALWEKSELVALAPFHLTSGPAGMTTLKLMGIGETDYLDFLVRQDRSQELYTRLLEAVERLEGWDLIWLEQVPLRRLPLIRQIFKPLGRPIQIKPRGHCYGLPLPERWEDFLSGLGQNQRYNIRRRTRTLEQQFGAVFRRISHSEDDVKRAVEAFFELMLKRLEVRKKRLAVEERTSMIFHLEVADRFAKRGWLNLCMLEVHQKPIAAVYVFQYNGRLLYYHSGFDPEWSKYSVGMVLLAKCMQDGIQQGMKEFDFMRGRSDYKWQWSVEERPFYRVMISKTLFGHIRHMGSSLMDRMKKQIRKRIA